MEKKEPKIREGKTRYGKVVKRKTSGEGPDVKSRLKQGCPSICVDPRSWEWSESLCRISPASWVAQWRGALARHHPFSARPPLFLSCFCTFLIKQNFQINKCKFNPTFFYSKWQKCQSKKKHLNCHQKFILSIEENWVWRKTKRRCIFLVLRNFRANITSMFHRCTDELQMRTRLILVVCSLQTD